MRYVGIDPGKKGGIVTIDKQGKILSKWIMPLEKNGELDLNAICAYAKMFDEHHIVYLEDPGILVGTSKTSMVVMGKITAYIQMALHCNNVEYRMVKPKDWQKKIWTSDDIVKVPSSTGRTMVNDTKAIAKNCADRLYPNESWLYGDNEKNTGRRTIDRDGLIDAALIAHYGKDEEI